MRPLLLVSVLSLCFVGCGSRLKLHKVTGTVKFPDGSVPQGEMATITFQPANVMEGKPASSNLEQDGSFQLFTLDQRDGGALAGDYRVIVHVTEDYPDLKFLVARKYADARETPLTATVKASQKNHFDFEVEKP